MHPAPVPFRLVALLLPLALSPFAAAQSPAPLATDGPATGAGVSAESFVARAGGAEAWRVVEDAVTGQPTFVYGSRYELTSPPRTLDEFEAAARQVVDENYELFGISSYDLVLHWVKPLELSRIGSSDKVAVVFDQIVDGIPVLGGHVTVLFERKSGAVLALDNTGVPLVRERANAAPEITVTEAEAAAREAYREKYGLITAELVDVQPFYVGPSARYGIGHPLADLGPVLAFQLELESPGLRDQEGLPVGARVLISSRPDRTVLSVEPTAHSVGGNVKGNVNTGPEPNTSSNQEQPVLKNLYVFDQADDSVLATTDVAGDFDVGAGPKNVYMILEGPHGQVDNEAGANARIDLTVNGSPVNALFNPAKSELTTAEVAAFYWIDGFRDWVKSVDADDTKLDNTVRANVNLNENCNAFFGGGFFGGSINFFTSGGGCTNTSYRSVVQHEEGHLANVRYNGGVIGSFHEGAADAWAYYISDDPCLYSFNSGGCLRNGEQTSVKKCNTDGDVSCHGGEVHTEGKALASALWAVRKELKQSLGSSAGGAAADLLFLSWFQTFNDGAILNVINDHWIALDDNDGNLFNLTPNFDRINDGFVAYNWPGVVVPDLVISQIDAPILNEGEAPGAAVVISADIVSNFGTVTGAELRYSTNAGGSYQTVAMAPTGGDRYEAQIPGFPLGTSVRWYIHTSGSVGGVTLTEPEMAPADVRVYHSGFFNQLATYSFENLFSEEGWTHVSLGGSNGDQWERANPYVPGSNEETDPIEAYSGIFVWGTDLSTTGNDGKYEPSSSGELRSPVFDFSDSSTVILQYRRCLAVERGIDDEATIRVNGVTVWQNPSNTNLIDNGWALHEVDISSLAANNPSVQLSWRLSSDGNSEFGGWNIDDVILYRVDVPPPSYFESYGSGCPGITGLSPTLTGQGIPAPGNDVTLTIANGLLLNPGVFLLATVPGNLPGGGGCDLLLGGAIFGSLNLTIGLGGVALLPVTIPATATTGDVYLQYFGADTGSGNGQFTVSNGLRIHVE